MTDNDLARLVEQIHQEQNLEGEWGASQFPQNEGENYDCT